MTRRELFAEVVARFPHLSTRQAEAVVRVFFDSMTEALVRGERIELRGFGSFVVKHRRARKGHNPKTGEVVSVTAKRVPFFKVGRELKQRIEGIPIARTERDRRVGLSRIMQNG